MFRFPSTFAIESASLLFMPLALLLLVWPTLLVPLFALPAMLLLLLPLFDVAFVVPEELTGAGTARWMKPPHALCDPLFRSTVITAGGMGFASGRSFFRCSWYFFFNVSTAASSCSAFGLPRLYRAMMR